MMRWPGQFRRSEPALPRRVSTSIPKYALYGDQVQPAWLDSVHVEQIHERSALFAYEIAPHVHDQLMQVLYVTRGGGEAVIEGQHHPFRAPALIVVPAQHVHGWHFHSDVDGPVVTAAQRPLESLAAVGAPDLLPHLRRPRVLDVGSAPRQAEALPPLFDAIEREYRLHAPEGAAAGTALLMAVFVQVARIAAAQPVDETALAAPQAAARTRKAAVVERFRAAVDARFRERWSVDQHADALGLSAGQLSRLCRAVLGVSALDVINARIVHEAERELVYSTLSIKQIAGVLGFADEAYFGRFFKKHAGQTPTEFREAAHRRLVRPA